MADKLYIDRITLPSNSTYYIKDTEARADIALITGAAALTFKGVSTTALTDGGTQKPTINNSQIALENLHVGDIYFYGSSEYIWGPNPGAGAGDPQYVWHELGNLTGLGGLAYKNSASTTYQPAGTINTISFTGSALTMSTSYTPAGGVTVNVTSTASAQYAVSKAASGGATYTPEGSVSTPSFTGTAANIAMSTNYTPAGGVSFTTANRTLEISTTTSGTKSYQPAGAVGLTSSSKTLNITASANTAGNYRPAGTVSTVAIGVNAAGATTSINNPSPKNVASAVTAAAPGATAPSNNLTYYDVSNENLRLYQIGYNTTASITTTSVTVKTGDASYKMNAAPTFSGTTAQLDVDSFTLPNGATFTGTTVHLVADSFVLPTAASFTGTASTISMSTGYTPAGTNSKPTFTGTGARLVTSTISIPDGFSGSFSGAAATITVSGTPSGSVTQPVFTGTTATITVS